jgi:hypothetical protein
MAHSLNNLISKAPPASAVEAGSSKPYVDYDTIYVDNAESNKIFGNWQDSASSACKDKAVNYYQIRLKIKGYDFDSDCPGSRNGVWLFKF